MSAQQKKHPFDFKTQYGLGFNPQDDEIVVDFFCGGGGAGTGPEMGHGHTVNVAKNHSPQAISMHTVNRPGAQHFTAAQRGAQHHHGKSHCPNYGQAAAPHEGQLVPEATLRWRQAKPATAEKMDRGRRSDCYGKLHGKPSKSTTISLRKTPLLVRASSFRN